MQPQVIFGISVLLALVVWGMIVARYVWPALRDRPRTEALRPLLLLHAFRFVGLAFLVPGVVSPDLPAAFAQPAAHGDLATSMLALLAIAMLGSRHAAVQVVELARRLRRHRVRPLVPRRRSQSRSPGSAERRRRHVIAHRLRRAVEETTDLTYAGGFMTIADRAVLVTGANRGIGQALVEEALRRGAKRVYAGARQPLAHPDGRVTPLTLDVTSAAQIQAAVQRVESLDILINNAGLALFDDLSDRAVLEQHLAVNLFGTYGVTQAFLPLLARSRGAIVNVLSDTAFAALPLIPAYSISKAAAFSLSQSLRALLAGRGVRVHAVIAGPVDTDMSRGFDVPKASPESVARAIFDGVEKGEEEIFPDPASASMAESWRSGAAKALERRYAALVGAAPVKS
jgi:NAD(P)-dependent dehydrogenase (short-subunit alcohol dehydrogenase family)